MATVTITYTPAQGFVNDPATEQIFGVWNPATTASDNLAFAGTYYQTNRWDNGEFPYATTLEQFLADQVAHPGLVAALRAAVRAEDHTYTWTIADEDEVYIEELAPALEAQGFKFNGGSSSAE